jgi:hypothetical protein
VEHDWHEKTTAGACGCCCIVKQSNEQYFLYASWCGSGSEKSFLSALSKSASTLMCFTIQPPESTSPIVLHPAHSDNFAKVVNELYSQLRGAYKVTCTSTELFNGLLDKLDKAVGIVEHSGHESDNLSSLPRAWEALAFLWLTRATQLAGIPGYDGRKPLTVFENQASDDEDLTPDDDEIDELEEMMKGARLE